MSIQLEGFHDNSICIKQYLTNGSFDCSTCADIYVLLNDADIALAKQLHIWLINYKKYYITYKLVPDDRFINNLLHSDVLFITEIATSAKCIYAYMKTRAYIYFIIWRIVIVVNFIILCLFYIVVLVYEDPCINCNYLLVHIVIMIVLNVIFGIVRIYANVASILEAIISIPAALYTIDTIQIYALCLFGYLFIVTFIHSICDMVSFKFK